MGWKEQQWPVQQKEEERLTEPPRQEERSARQVLVESEAKREWMAPEMTQSRKAEMRVC